MNALPEELVEQVVSYIDCPTTLASVNLTNKQLNRVSTPFIYRHIAIIRDHPLLLDRPLRALTATVVTRPELAVHVHTLSLRPIWQYPSRTKQELQPAIVAAIDATSADEQAATRWKCDAQVARNLDAMLALLVPRLTNLTRLGLEIPPNAGEWWMRALADRPSSNCHRLEELVLKSCNPSTIREMANRAPGDYDHDTLLSVDTAPMTADTITSYARAFSPRILRVHHVGETDYDRDIRINEIQLRLAEVSQPRTDTVSVEHLELRKADTDMDFIWDLLVACKALRTFIFEYAGGYWDMNDMVEMLQLHKDSLQQLYLDVDNGNMIHPVHSLSGLTQLRELHINAGLLFHGNSRYREAEARPNVLTEAVAAELPPQLSRLRIKDCEYRDLGVEYFLKASSQSGRESLLALRRLEIEAMDKGAGLKLLIRLLEQTAAAEGVGITLNLIARTNVGYWAADDESGWGFDEEVCWLTPLVAKRDGFQLVTPEVARVMKKKEFIRIRDSPLSSLG